MRWCGSSAGCWQRRCRWLWAVFAILGSLAVLRATALVTDVSIFALNVTVALGLALAIDYTLLIVSRYRDELADGWGRDDALVRTMTTAGRTVLFSAMTVALALVATALFPMYFLKSFAYAGIAVVAFSALAAVVVAPTVIVLLGDRLDALNVWNLGRRLFRRPATTTADHRAEFLVPDSETGHAACDPVGPGDHPLSARVGRTVPRRQMGLSRRPGTADRHRRARVVSDRIRSDFNTNSQTTVTIVIPETAGLAKHGPRQLRRAAVPGYRCISGVLADRHLRRRCSPQARRRAQPRMADGSAYLSVDSTAPLYTPASEIQLARLHAIAPPGHQAALMTGIAQMNRDCVNGHYIAAAVGVRFHRGRHAGAAFPPYRQCGTAGQGGAAKYSLADRGVRRSGLDLSRRAPGRGGHHTYRHTGRRTSRC